MVNVITEVFLWILITIHQSCCHQLHAEINCAITPELLQRNVRNEKLREKLCNRCPYICMVSYEEPEMLNLQGY